MLSFTNLHAPPEGFESPLLMALIQLEHEAVILALADVEITGKTEMGSAVTVSKDAEGRFRYKLS